VEPQREQIALLVERVRDLEAHIPQWLVTE
jgi:hypothetical protein